MNIKERAEMVRSMEVIARCVNYEPILESWLMCGVADGDINANTTDEDLDYYCEDDNFADLMALFLRMMVRANMKGGLYCDKIVGENENDEKMKKKRITEILINYIDNDLETADPGYVREVLRDCCGCTDDELKELGIYDWLGFNECEE